MHEQTPPISRPDCSIEAVDAATLATTMLPSLRLQGHVKAHQGPDEGKVTLQDLAGELPQNVSLAPCEHGTLCFWCWQAVRGCLVTPNSASNNRMDKFQGPLQRPLEAQGRGLGVRGTVCFWGWQAQRLAAV
jgi:hypothetical protein